MEFQSHGLTVRTQNASQRQATNERNAMELKIFTAGLIICVLVGIIGHLAGWY